MWILSTPVLQERDYLLSVDVISTSLYCAHKFNHYLIRKWGERKGNRGKRAGGDTNRGRRRKKETEGEKERGKE